MRRIGSSLAIAYAIVLYGFIFLPVIVLVLFSFQGTLFPIPPFNGPSLRWYQAAFGDARLTAALGNSLMVAAASSGLAVVLGFLAAFGFARYRVRGAGVLRGVLAAPLSVSYLIIGMGLLILFNGLGVPKSLLAVTIGHVVINLPLCFAILYSQMGEHQVNIERAARDLGARDWQVLLYITAPMLWPALFAGFFLSMTFARFLCSMTRSYSWKACSRTRCRRRRWKTSPSFGSMATCTKAQGMDWSISIIGCQSAEH